MVAQARDGPRAVAPQERRQPSTGDRASALELAAVVASGQRGLDQRSRDAARQELRAQARRAVAARGAGGDPVAGGGGGVEISGGGEGGGDGGGGARGVGARATGRGGGARGRAATR